MTSVPSPRRPRLVSGFAARLAEALALPFHPALEVVETRPEQKTMANSVQQARNVDGSLAIPRDRPLPGGPVLLVDDLTDSGWTLTVAAWLLRRRGSGEVWPLVLASTGRRR